MGLVFTFSFRQEPLDSTWRGSIQSHFLQRAAMHPNRVAVVFKDKSYSYREISQCAIRLANRLRNNGVTPGDVVGLYGHRSPAVVVAIMGILISGAAYCMMVLPTQLPLKTMDI